MNKIIIQKYLKYTVLQINVTSNIGCQKLSIAIIAIIPDGLKSKPPIFISYCISL